MHLSTFLALQLPRKSFVAFVSLFCILYFVIVFVFVFDERGVHHAAEYRAALLPRFCIGFCIVFVFVFCISYLYLYLYFVFVFAFVFVCI